MSTIYSIAIKLSLDEVNQLKNSLSIATQEIKKASTGITGIVSNSAKQMKELANNSIVQAVGVGAVVAGMTKAIKTGIEFEDTFLRATAKIKGGVKQGSEEFNKLESLVLELGAKTEFSTSEAVQGLEFWAKVGKTTNEIMQLLPKSLDMATASGLDLARASDIISDAIGIFNLNSSDMNELSANTERIMDNMSKTATMTNTSIEELFETSKIAGGIFTTAGQSIETFNSAAAILADNSMKGSVAGTNLRAIMAKLASPVAKARDVLDTLGISISDKNGNMKDLADILDDIKEKTDRFGNAEKLAIFKVLVGQEAMNGLNFLVKEGGDKLREYRTELEKSAGSTKELAELFRTDTKADWDNFTSAVEGLAITLFKYLQPAIKVVLQSITGLIDLVNTLTNNGDDNEFLINILLDDSSTKNIYDNFSKYLDFKKLIVNDREKLIRKIILFIFNEILVNNINLMDGIKFIIDNFLEHGKSKKYFGDYLNISDIISIYYAIDDGDIIYKKDIKKAINILFNLIKEYIKNYGNK